MLARSTGVEYALRFVTDTAIERISRGLICVVGGFGAWFEDEGRHEGGIRGEKDCWDGHVGERKGADREGGRQSYADAGCEYDWG